MSPWRVALLSMIGMVTTAVAVYKLTPQQPPPTSPAATPSAVDELPDEPSVVDELPPVPPSVTAAPDAPQRVPAEQRAAPAPSLTSAPQRVPTEQRAAPAPLPAAPVSTIPPAVAASSGAPAGLAPELGTLVAVAVGGSCEFSVDGQSITSSTTLRLKLPPGAHVVECGSRTRIVTIRNRETKMAFFNLKK
ncbi:hypothetical protein [Polyangium spumosum]|uniref:PEGA domain-containing protein n=1 Tax=Polyangium spumosum TaxID=889282 RepID=A0A6N7Q6N1_9BACT|nr:hypothetical protein [Polyangium spumosum]MRG98570.1 hypothetical protein [Polyangium spumosum]